MIYQDNKKIINMSKRALFHLVFLMAAMVLTVSCTRKAVFGKSPIGKVVAAMTLEEKAGFLVCADDAIRTFAIPRLGIPSVNISECPTDLGIGVEASMIAQGWNLDLVRKVTTATGIRLKRAGTDWIVLPELDIKDSRIRDITTAAIAESFQSNGIGTVLRGYETGTVIPSVQPLIIMTSLTPDNMAVMDSVLRNEYSFDGAVMACIKSDSISAWVNTLTESVRRGELKESVLDTYVERLLGVMALTPEMQGYDPDKDVTPYSLDGMQRSALTEGMVLLKNNGVLPFSGSCNMIALYGVHSYDLFATALKEAGYKLEPSVQTAYGKYANEQTIPESLERKPFRLRADAISSDVAVITIGRSKITDPVDYLLTPTEKGLIEDVCDAFHSKNKKVVVILNAGGPIDTDSWKSQPDAILLAGQSCPESGNVATDILKGIVNPSGRLAESFSKDYPFGYGLSYTTFSYSDPEQNSEDGTVSVKITNTGTVPGKGTVLAFSESSGHALELHSFGKTGILQPGETQIMEFSSNSRDGSYGLTISERLKQ